MQKPSKKRDIDDNEILRIMTMQKENNGPDFATTNKTKYETLKDVQNALIVEIKSLFIANRKNLVCIHDECGATGDTNISNKGKGGGVLQQGLVGNQFKCNTCGRCTGLGKLLEHANLPEEKSKYDTILVKHQTLAAKLGEPKTKQSSIKSFFMSPQTGFT